MYCVEMNIKHIGKTTRHGFFLGVLVDTSTTATYHVTQPTQDDPVFVIGGLSQVHAFHWHQARVETGRIFLRFTHEIEIQETEGLLKMNMKL